MDEEQGEKYCPALGKVINILCVIFIFVFSAI